MNPYEHWDDWEWEKAIREVGRDGGRRNNGGRHPDRPFKMDFFKNWNGMQKKTLLAALLFLTVYFGSRGTDLVSQGVYGLYRNTVSSGSIYASLNATAKEVIGLDGTVSEAIPVDAAMQGKLLPPVSGKVVAAFGLKGENGEVHNGIDVASSVGTPVVAPAKGVVFYIGEDAQLGRIVKLDIGDGWVVELGNLGEVSVAKGTKVEKGDQIGTVGLSAPLKKPWLHFGLRKNNKPLNPIPYLMPANPQTSQAQGG